MASIREQLLEHELHQAQWTVSFLHGCLVEPEDYHYAYPFMTRDRLRCWGALAPTPPLSLSSRLRSDGPPPPAYDEYSHSD